MILEIVSRPANVGVPVFRDQVSLTGARITRSREADNLTRLSDIDRLKQVLNRQSLGRAGRLA